MTKEVLHKLLEDLCRTAYIEGREHENRWVFPDVGMAFDKKFKDTKTFKILEKYYPK